MESWIKIRTDLVEDPAVIGMSDILEIDETYVIGLLVMVWSWADRHVADDGVAGGMSDRRIDRIARHDGVASAMRSVGWLADAPGGGVMFPNYIDHNGSTSKSRARTSKRVAKHRAGNAHTVTNVTPSSLPEKIIKEKIDKPCDDLPSDQPRFQAIEAVERLLGRKLSIHEIDRFDQWTATVPESCTLGDQAYTRYTLIVAASSAAIDTMQTTPRNLGGATTYLQRVIDRCINEDCKPGEYKPREKTSRRKPEPNANPEDTKVKLI